MYLEYEDITGKEFNLHPWCDKFNRNCEDVPSEWKKNFCIGRCNECTELERDVLK